MRRLTIHERQLAVSVFGASLALDEIKLYACGWVFRGYAISPNGHVYFHPDDWQDDFALASLAVQGWLIHELTHVWQVQQGIHVFRRALFDRRYRYVLRDGQPFLHYGVEQQAQLVQDYFVRRAQGQDCTAYERCLPFL
ncbi:MAG: hypothetical protein RL180_888 [Pseudomonadota bacterium]